MNTTAKGFATNLTTFLLSAAIIFGVVSAFPTTTYADAPPMLRFFPDNNYGPNGIGALVYDNADLGQRQVRLPQNTAIEELGGGSYSWDYDSRVLTLNNVSFTTRNVFGFEITGWDGPIEINLIGDNSFTTTNSATPSPLDVGDFTLGMCQPVALFAKVDITVTGTGSLALNSINGNGLCSYNNESAPLGPKSFDVKSGTVEITGGARAVCVPTGGYFGVAADEYTYWVNSDASAPLGGGTPHPGGLAYAHNNNDKYVKIASGPAAPPLGGGTLRFAANDGKLYWFAGGPEGSPQPEVSASELLQRTGGSYVWDPLMRTLTFNNINFATSEPQALIIAQYPNEGGGHNEQPISLNLVGANSFATTYAVQNANLPMQDHYSGLAVHCEMGVTVIGSGSLSIQSGNCGLLSEVTNTPNEGVPQGKHFTVKSGSVEIIGGQCAAFMSNGGTFSVSASSYTYWANPVSGEMPSSGGTAYPNIGPPAAMPYTHSDGFKYVKIDAGNVLPNTHKTVRFATATGRLVWFENIGLESEGPVMPLIAPEDTAIAELGGGSYNWDKATRTLTLNNIKFTTDGDQAFIISPHENKSDDPLNPSEAITLKLSGANAFISAGIMPGGLALHSELDISVSGDGSLTLGCANGTGLRPVIAYNNAALARSFIISSGTVEIYGGTQAVDVPSWERFRVSAQSYQYWANSGGAQFPGGGATAYPGAAYKYNSDSKYVKIEAPAGPEGTPPHITTQELPAGTIGVAYKSQLEATGSPTTFSWFTLGDALPPGLSLSSKGLISGAPAATGEFTFMVGVSNGVDPESWKTFTIKISPEGEFNTVRFATTTGRLVWFVGGIPEGKGAVMPPIAQPNTPMPELGGGWYAWNPASRVLTLANVHFTTSDIQAFIISPYENEHSDPENPEKPITLKLVGGNSFITTYEEPPVGLGGLVAPSMFSGGLALHSELDIAVMGDGSLYLGGGNGTGLLSVTADDAHTPTSFKVASGTTEVSGGACAVRVPAGGSFGPSAASYGYLANAASASAPIGNMTAYPGGAAYAHSNKYKYVMITAPYGNAPTDTPHWNGGNGWAGGGGGYTYNPNAPSTYNPNAPSITNPNAPSITSPNASSPNQSQGMPSDAISKLMSPTREAGESVAATVSNNTLVLNGEEILVPAVKIDDWNWIRARDLAAVLNGTRKQFGIHWNAVMNTASIRSGEPYEMSGGEMGALHAGSLDTVASPQNFVADGRMVKPAAYNVNGNNFVRLRDMAILLNFGIRYDDKSGEATFDLDGGYTE